MTLQRADLEHNPEYYIMAHPADSCRFPDRCVVHNRSNHRMRHMTQHFRGDRGLMERICEHGVGHPDPDALYYYKQVLTPSAAIAEAVHGCDGCCDYTEG